MQILGLVAIGIVAGVAAGMFGIGGGLIIVPALVLLYKMSQHAAVGTSLGAILLPVGALLEERKPERTVFAADRGGTPRRRFPRREARRARVGPDAATDFRRVSPTRIDQDDLGKIGMRV
jgi:hypothetical protein